MCGITLERFRPIWTLALPFASVEAKMLLRAAKLYNLPRLNSICKSYTQRMKK
jgi:hypothetical protein